MTPAAALAIGSIGWYQRVVSPRKGFRCAYGVRHGRGTCSSIVLEAFRVRGALGGTAEFFRQSLRCYHASVALTESIPTDLPSMEPAGVGGSEKNSGWWSTYFAFEGTACCCSLPVILS